MNMPRDEWIYGLWRKGFSKRRLAKMHGLSSGRINQICNKQARIARGRMHESIVNLVSVAYRFGPTDPPTELGEGEVRKVMDVGSFNHRLSQMLEIQGILTRNEIEWLLDNMEQTGPLL